MINNIHPIYIPRTPSQKVYGFLKRQEKQQHNSQSKTYLTQNENQSNLQATAALLKDLHT